jgi:hypothetical protein
MPAAMTFDSLRNTDFPAYVERGFVNDPVVYDQIPSLINLAERDIVTTLKILGFLNPVNGTMTAGVSVYPKPDRWRATASINIGVGDPALDEQERTPIFPRSYEYCNDYWPNRALEDQPEFYSDYDYSHILVVPTPDQDYPFEWNYWQQPPLLDETNQTNWLTDFAPNLLLYGTLVQSFPFLKDGPWKEQWKGMYGDELSAVNTQDLQRVIDRTTVRRTV